MLQFYPNIQQVHQCPLLLEGQLGQVLTDLGGHRLDCLAVLLRKLTLSEVHL